MVRKTMVKLYSWKDLTRLAIADMQTRMGEQNPDAEFHYIGGLDFEMNPFIRVDMDPLRTEETPKDEC
jgi:hypothetical protein